jgi:succinyl-CoA:acetate CoA-transferase
MATTTSRIHSSALRSKIMSAEEAVGLIPAGVNIGVSGFTGSGVNIGVSGFTGSGYPKATPEALARRITEANQAGQNFKVGVWTSASTAPELDGVLAKVEGVKMRLPFQADPTCRQRINQGEMDYFDMHLSHVAQFARSNFLGKIEVAIIEVVGILEDGRLIPSTAIGNSKTWIDEADKVIVEVNAAQNEKLEGMHDIYYGITQPPERRPIPIIYPDDRIGTPYLNCPLEKIIAIVETNTPDRNNPFKEPDEDSRRIAGHLLDFMEWEIKKGRLPHNLLPLQSGVGNIPNAVLEGLNEGPFENLTAYTEVLQDGMLAMLRSGKLLSASATAFSLSAAAMADFNQNIEEYRHKIVLRPQEISNHPEVIRRLGCLAMNAMIEADIYGNVNSTHVMGTGIQNGIGGSGDFTRNGHLAIFMTPSKAKNGAISCIVPMVSHIDHTEHDVQVIVTEQGLADLRGLSPKQRALQVIENCAHPDYKPALREYYRRSLEFSPSKQTPHLLEEAFSWHLRYLRTGSMQA